MTAAVKLCHCSLEADGTPEAEPRELSSMKRHSEGTFSNDYSKYLEDRKAQDFVRWLMNNKRSGSVCIVACMRCQNFTYCSIFSHFRLNVVCLS